MRQKKEPSFQEPKGFDPELVYVECGRCGAPVIWENGRATSLLSSVGIDPMELDPYCILITDGCPACGASNEYRVRIFRVGADNKNTPPVQGHA